MRYAIPLALLLVTTTTAVQAQQSNGSDTEQILKLLQGMNGRFDQLEKRLDKLEQAEPDVKTQADVPVTPAPEPTAQSDSVAIPGWKIDVLPYTKQGLASAPVARLNAAIGKIMFSMHLTSGDVRNPAMYKGTAFFNAKAEGDYTFNMLLADEIGDGKCGDGTISIEGTNLFEPLFASGTATMSGSIKLESGKYKIEFTAGCWPSYNDDKSTPYSDRLLYGLKESSVHIKVIGPDDMSLRDFEPDELFYIGKKPKEQKRSEVIPSEEWVPPDEPKMLYAAAEPITEPDYRPAPGMGVTTRTANFRIAPTRSAISPFQIPAGVQLHILQKFPDWYKIRTPEGDIGFVHRSLVATN